MKVFPELLHNAKILGCTFHYGQIIIRRVRLMGLLDAFNDNAPANDIVRRVVRTARGLPLAPPGFRNNMWMFLMAQINHPQPQIQNSLMVNLINSYFYSF